MEIFLPMVCAIPKWCANLWPKLVGLIKARTFYGRALRWMCVHALSTHIFQHLSKRSRISILMPAAGNWIRCETLLAPVYHFAHTHETFGNAQTDCCFIGNVHVFLLLHSGGDAKSISTCTTMRNMENGIAPRLIYVSKCEKSNRNFIFIRAGSVGIS